MLSPINPEYARIASLYGVTVERVSNPYGEQEPSNYGACAGDEIFMCEFDDPDKECVAFFHELGHTQIRNVMPTKTHGLCTMSVEGFAWEYGLYLASKHGFVYDYYHPALKWAREQLKSYNSDQNFN